MKRIVFAAAVLCSACSKPAENAAAPSGPTPPATATTVNASHDPRQFPGMVKSAQDAAATAEALNAKTQAQAQSAGE